jgi:ABC-2 type transport system permease protein
MTRLIAAELRKLRTVRSGQLILAALIVFAVLATFAITTAAGTDGNPPLTPESYPDALRAPLSLLTGGLLVLGILAMAGEYRHGTVVGTFLTAPRRHRVVAAKAVALAFVGAVTAIVVSAVSSAVAVPIFADKHVDLQLGSGDSVTVVAGIAAAAALYGALGVALGGVLRNQTAAVTVALVWMLAVEGLLPDILRVDGLGRWLPWGTVKAVTQWDGALPVVTGAVLLVGYVAALLAAGTVLVRRSDVV